MTFLSFRIVPNLNAGTPGIVVLTAAGFRRARAEITSWPDYEATPLHGLATIAATAGVGCLRLKDESGRFGLGSFKPLGAAYAVRVRLAGLSACDVTLTCATDGNHGRAVAWAARRFGCAAVIFVHAGVSQARADAIAAYGATIRRVPGNYDDAVRQTNTTAAAEGWLTISDTSWPGYTEIPRDIMQGYRLMADEALGQWQGAPPTHVFVQGGVGGMAAAVSVQLRAAGLSPAKLIVVEPERAACLLASAEQGAPATVAGDLDTIMAGLACGEPSLLAWQELSRAAAAFMAIPDKAARDSMRLLFRHGIVIGESGVAGLAGFLLAASNPVSREMLGLDGDSRILVFGTEGATDPALFAAIVEEGSIVV